MELIGTIITIISIIVGVFGIIVAFVPNIRQIIFPQTKKWRKEYLSKHLDFPSSDFQDHLHGIYIQPYFTFKQSGDPKQLLRDYFINQVFVKGSNRNRIFCLLGDTGTGKTAALTHLFKDYIDVHSERDLPYDIRIYSLRDKDTLQTVSSKPDEEKKKTILLLDAVDESPLAEDPAQRHELDRLLNEICQHHAYVHL